MEQSLDKQQLSLQRAHQALSEILSQPYMNSSILQQYQDIQPLVIQQLIYYMLLNPIELKNQNCQNNMPYKFCEFLENCDDQVLAIIFDTYNQFDVEQTAIQTQLCDNLFSILINDTINETTCGYFARVIKSFIDRKGIQIWNYLENNKRMISCLIKHVDQFSISDILLNLILFNNREYESIDYNNQILKLIDRLFQLIVNRSEEQEIVENVCWIFNEIMNRASSSYNITQNEDNQRQNQLLEQIIQQLNFPDKFFYIAQFSNSAQPYIFIKKLIIYNKNQSNQINLEECCRQLPNRLLDMNIKFNKFDNTFKNKSNVFGYKRYQLLELTQQIIELKSENLIDILLKNKLFLNLQNLIQQHPYNNSIQLIFIKIVQTVVETINLEQYLDIFQSLVNFVIMNYNEKHNDTGYRNCQTQIANIFLKSEEFNNQFQRVDSWTQFKEKKLIKINHEEQTFLLNYDPRNSEQNY